MTTHLSRIVLFAAAAALFAACGHAAVPAAASPPARQRVEFVPLPDMEAVHVRDPHDYQGRTLCQRCHVPGEERPSFDPVALCTQCHDRENMRHPVGIAQPGDAQGLPLVEGDRIVCHTCHDPHAVKAYPHGLRSEYVPLCKRCHAAHGASGRSHGRPQREQPDR